MKLSEIRIALACLGNIIPKQSEYCIDCKCGIVCLELCPILKLFADDVTIRYPFNKDPVIEQEDHMGGC